MAYSAVYKCVVNRIIIIIITDLWPSKERLSWLEGLCWK